MQRRYRLASFPVLAIAALVSGTAGAGAAPAVCRAIFDRATGYADAADAGDELRTFTVSRFCEAEFLGSGGDQEADFLYRTLSETGGNRGRQAFARRECRGGFGGRSRDDQVSPPIQRLGGDALDAWRSCVALAARGYDVDVELLSDDDIRVTIRAVGNRSIRVRGMTSVPRDAVTCSSIAQRRSNAGATVAIECRRTKGPANPRFGPLRRANYAYFSLDVDRHPLMVLFPAEDGGGPGGRPDGRPGPGGTLRVEVVGSKELQLGRAGGRCGERRAVVASDDGRTFCAITGMTGGFARGADSAEVLQDDGMWILRVQGCPEIAATATCFRIRN